ncbi:hypothetical protein MFRU_021g00160 [Monilinia fructicola]|nr:hypothetical protein MFRU_021g00160 [Monilinia fructicola]
MSICKLRRFKISFVAKIEIFGFALQKSIAGGYKEYIQSPQMIRLAAGQERSQLCAPIDRQASAKQIF